MKLKYIKDHKSIKNFVDVELPNFVVLTGVNGSGKTHLLEAIGDSVVLEVDGIENKDSVYFDYNDFIVKETPTNKQTHKTIKKTQDEGVINAGIKRLLVKINEKIEEFENSYKGDTGSHLPNKLKEFANYLVQEMFRNRINFPETVSLKDISWPGELGEEEKEKIYVRFTDLMSELGSLKGFKRYYETSQQRGVHLSGLQANQVIYNESFLGQLLENEFKAYRDLQTKNDNNFKPSQRGENCEYFDDTQFETKHGTAPWHFLNEILNKYGCNNYLVNWENLPRPQYPQTPQQFVLNITVKNGKGIPVPIVDLSSGEKTLLALAYQIYRNRRGSNLPEVLLLDEIDSCLHPSMTRQLLNVMKEVFIDKYDMKIILVTHSPSTVALAEEDSVFVMNNGGENRIEKKTKEEALSILTEGFMTFDEGVKILNAQKPYLYVEGDYDVDYIKKAAEHGHDKNSVLARVEMRALGGDEQLKTHFNCLEKVLDKISIPQKHLYFFDCDVDVTELGEGNLLYKRKIDIVDENPLQKGIENLFQKTTLERALEHSPSFIIKSKTEISCGEETQTNELWELNPDQKRNLCDWICEHGKKNDFSSFEALFEKINSILSTQSS